MLILIVCHAYQYKEIPEDQDAAATTMLKVSFIDGLPVTASDIAAETRFCHMFINMYWRDDRKEVLRRI